MLEFVKAWFATVPDSMRVMASVAAATLFLGGGLVDTRVRVGANQRSIDSLTVDFHVVDETLDNLEEDVDDILCMLILSEEGGDPLTCVRDHRYRRD